MPPTHGVDEPTAASPAAAPGAPLPRRPDDRDEAAGGADVRGPARAAHDAARAGYGAGGNDAARVAHDAGRVAHDAGGNDAARVGNDAARVGNDDARVGSGAGGNGAGGAGNGAGRVAYGVGGDGGGLGAMFTAARVPSLPDLPPLRDQGPSGLPPRREPTRREPPRRARPADPGPSGDQWAPPTAAPVADPYPGRAPGGAFAPTPGPGLTGAPGALGGAVPPAGPAPAPSGDRWAGPAPSGDRWAAPTPGVSGDAWAPPASGDQFAPAGAPSGDRYAAAGGPSGERRPRPARRPKPEPTGGLKPVYDVDGPKVRLGVGWFLVAVAAVALSPLTAALCYGVAAGWAARQVVQAWRSVSWQADLAAGLGALPVVAALAGAVPAGIGLAVAIVVGSGVALFHPEGARLPGKGGRLAGAAILGLAVVPSIAGAAVVLTRTVDVTSAVVLVLMVSAYEAADFVVGSGASNVIEGPLAGATTAVLCGIPLTLVLIPPFDDAGMVLLIFVAVTPVIGQVMASTLLPRAGTSAPALRRLDSLLVLGLVWVAASAAF